MIRMIAIAAVAALFGTMPAQAEAPAAAALTPVAQLRAQNAALRDRMGRLQLDLLIADVLADRAMPTAPIRHAAAAARVQVASLRK